MKNAIKKMKWTIAALCLLMGLGIGLTLKADIKYFWLDHPTGRTNPNDPLSPLYKSPTPIGNQAPAGTATVTPTISATPSGTPSDTPQGTLTDTPTPSATPTVTSTFTPEAVGGWPCVYGTYSGGVVPLGTNGYLASAPGTGDLFEVTSSDGAGGSTFYTDVTLSSTDYSSAVVFSTGFTSGGVAITQTVGTGSYTSLSISVAVPPLYTATNPSLIVPGVSLVYNVSGETYTAQTVVLNLDNFLIGGPQFIQPSTSTSSLVWYTAVIPISVFETLCNTTTGVTATAADLTAFVGVEVQPANYGQTGAITTEVDVDNIIFNSAANPACPTGLNSFGPGNAFSGLFSDFENGTEDNWGGYWSTNFDGITSTGPTYCSTCTAQTGPCTGGAGTLIAPTYTGYGPITCSGDCWTVVSYGGVTDSVTAADGTDDPTPSHAAHFAGWFGNENGQYSGSGGSGNVDCGTTPATGSLDYPYLNMTANTYPATATTQYVDLSNNTFLTTLPATGATGMSVMLMPGANNGPNQVYGIGIGTTTNSASAGNMFFFQVASSSLTAGKWVQFVVTFPADGTTGGTDGNPDPTGYHAQGSTDTELFFAQEEYAGYGAFSRNNVNQVEVESFLHNQPVDLYIDDIQFFSGTGPVAAERRAAQVIRGGMR